MHAAMTSFSDHTVGANCKRYAAISLVVIVRWANGYLHHAAVGEDDTTRLDRNVIEWTATVCFTCIRIQFGLTVWYASNLHWQTSTSVRTLCMHLLYRYAYVVQWKARERWSREEENKERKEED